MSLASDAPTKEDPYADWKGWDPRDFGRCSAHDARYFTWHLQRAMGSQYPALRVLELGFGNGRFMGWLQQHGHSVTGVETNQRLVDVARQAGFAALSDLSQTEPGERFDLIAAFDVIEHVPVAKLEALLSDLAACLTPQGRLLLRFPNGESPFGLWMQQGDLTHVHAIGLSKIAQLCTACRLRLEHSGEALPWRAQLPQRRLGAAYMHLSRRLFEWWLRKMYQLPRGLDLSPNQLVVLSHLPPAGGDLASD
jgi:SAM-dependent methyltransferase